MNELQRKWVKIKKDRQCFGCLRKFPKGSKLNYSAIAEDGSVFGTYHCEPCERYCNFFRLEELPMGWMKDEMNGINCLVEIFVHFKIFVHKNFKNDNYCRAN